MLDMKTPDPDSQSFKVEDVLAKAEEIRNTRDRQSSVTNSDLGEAFKLFTVVDEESKLLTKERDLFKPVKIFWNWTGFREKKLLDLVQILFVPVAIAAAGIWFQDNIKGREESSAKIKTVEELKVADSKAKQETLTKYLDQMSDLLEKGLLKSKQDSPIFIIAQSKTVIALQSLDTERQRLLIQFFKSANLNTLDGGKGLLFKARMSKAQLQKIDLRGIKLKGADLSGANLSRANLSDVDLSEADLREVELYKANLSNANLSGADLRDARIFFTNVFQALFEKEKEKEIEKALVCGITLPEKVNIGGYRNCDVMADILFERHPKLYKTREEARDSIPEVLNVKAHTS
jgi:uncharacterized protein YjbI with pentapeptide repeats